LVHTRGGETEPEVREAGERDLMGRAVYGETDKTGHQDTRTSS